MIAIVTELFERFLSDNHFRDESCLGFRRIHTEVETASEGNSLLHVLIEHKKDGGTKPLAIAIVTPPTTSPHAPEKLDFAVRKARAYKAPYFLVWTLREATLWKTPSAGDPVSNMSLDKLRDYPTVFQVGMSTNEVMTEPVKLEILEVGRGICADLISLSKDEALELVQLEATYFVERLLQSVRTLVPVVGKSIAIRLGDNAVFRKEISEWAPRQSISGSSSDPDFAVSIARHTVYRLLGKILFYQSLRKAHERLPKLDLKNVDVGQVLPTLWNAFQEALKIDYHSVFQQDVTDVLKWPKEAAEELARLVDDFNTRDFSELPQDVIGTVFERLIPPEERHLLGQYFTSENLCDLIVAFCVSSPNDRVFDPTCGTGTFLIRSYDKLCWLGCRDHAQLLSQLWGVDVAPFPAELAVINLFGRRVAEHNNFPRIICNDFVSISPGDLFPFPPPKAEKGVPVTIKEQIPMFDAIVGNFPYVSGDQIERQEKAYLEKLRQSMIEGWLEEYPELFYYKNKARQKIFKSAIATGRHMDTEREDLELKLSVYSDLYVYLFFHATKFLKMGGRMGIVTSNAWLNVGYGYELQKFFLKHFKVIAILESRCEPWFVEASVNTVVTIIEKCDSAEERGNNLIHFVKVKRKLDELFPDDPATSEGRRWDCIDSFVTCVNKSSQKYSKTYPLELVTEETDNARIRILRQSEMLDELSASKKTVKWGRYLRSPDVYTEITKRGRMCLLRDIATPRRGGTTRINAFFHVKDAVAQEFGIEQEYLLSFIKSPKDTNTIDVVPGELKTSIFVCRKSKETLMQSGHKGALRYIEWGESQAWADGSLWKDGKWVRGRIPGWWALPQSETHEAQLFLTKGTDEKHIQRYSPKMLVPDQRLYYLDPIAGNNISVIAAILNSFLTCLAIELTAPLTAGDGVCELRVDDARDYLLVPDCRLASASELRSVLASFDTLRRRPILTVFEEVKRSDRRELDSTILNAIGLDPKQFLKPIYDGICELVSERIVLGRVRNEQRSARSRGDRSEKRTNEQVLNEVLPSGPKRFPEEFFSAAARTSSSLQIELPDKAVLFEDTPLSKRIYAPGTNFNYDVSNSAEGRYILYSRQAGHKEILMPRQMVEITRTVANYEKYLRNLREELYSSYFRVTLDHKTAAKLTQAAFDKFRLPSVDA